MKDRIIRLQEHINRYKQLVAEDDGNLTTGKLQQLSLQVKAEKSRIKALQKEIRDIINTPILEVTYASYDKRMKVILANITEEDIRTLFNLINVMNKEPIRILEIRQIPNFIEEVQL